MTRKATSEECARESLRVFVREFGGGGDQALALAAFEARRFDKCRTPADSRHGLEFAVERGWVRIEAADRSLRMEPAGWAAAHTLLDSDGASDGVASGDPDVPDGNGAPPHTAPVTRREQFSFDAQRR